MFLFSLTKTVLSITSLVSFASAGINCKGVLCAPVAWTLGTSNNLVADIDGIDVNRVYANGEHIACYNDGGHGLCAFLQSVPSNAVSGGDIKTLIHDLQGHGCSKCGSVPIEALTGGNGDDQGF